MGTAISAKAHTKTGRSVPMSEGGPFACTPSQSSRSGRDLSPKPGHRRLIAPYGVAPGGKPLSHKHESTAVWAAE